MQTAVPGVGIKCQCGVGGVAAAAAADVARLASEICKEVQEGKKKQQKHRSTINITTTAIIKNRRSSAGIIALHCLAVIATMPGPRDWREGGKEDQARIIAHNSTHRRELGGGVLL